MILARPLNSWCGEHLLAEHGCNSVDDASCYILCLGDAACRYPEGTVLLLRNIKFNSWYKEKLQLGFADSDSLDMNMSKADSNLDITKRLKSWFSSHGDVKLSSIDDIRRKVRGSMVIVHAMALSVVDD